MFYFFLFFLIVSNNCLAIKTIDLNYKLSELNLDSCSNSDNKLAAAELHESESENNSEQQLLLTLAFHAHQRNIKLKQRAIALMQMLEEQED